MSVHVCDRAHHARGKFPGEGVHRGLGREPEALFSLNGKPELQFSTSSQVRILKREPFKRRMEHRTRFFKTHEELHHSGTHAFGTRLRGIELKTCAADCPEGARKVLSLSIEPISLKERGNRDRPVFRCKAFRRNTLERGRRHPELCQIGLRERALRIGEIGNKRAIRRIAFRKRTEGLHDET